MDAVGDLGDASFEAKRYGDALLLFERVGRGKVPLDAFPLANAKKIALVLDRLGQRDRAAVEARRMASGFEKPPSGGTWAAGAGATAGDILERSGDHDEAIVWYEKALRVFDDGTSEAAAVQSSLGAVYEVKRNYKNALERYPLARGTRERLNGKDDPDYGAVTAQ